MSLKHNPDLTKTVNRVYQTSSAMLFGVSKLKHVFLRHPKTPYTSGLNAVSGNESTVCIQFDN